VARIGTLNPENIMRISRGMPDQDTFHEAVHTPPSFQRRYPTEAVIPGAGETKIEKRIDAMEMDWITNNGPWTKRQPLRTLLIY